MSAMNVFEFFSHIIFVAVVGFYLITNLQWFNYKIERVVLNHTKPKWHLIYLLLPFLLYHFTSYFFWIYFYFAYIPSLFLWHKNIDKKLIFTKRVKRFFAILIGVSLFQNILCILSDKCEIYGIFLPLFMTIIATHYLEKLLMRNFKSSAKNKLKGNENLKIIAITASYGKTSIKNFLAQILNEKYRIHFTPRSVNTLNGIIKDINENLTPKVDIYIVEAGARERGDIKEIVEFLHPEYVVVGKIGRQHIEYFKTIENIIETKLEILESNRLKKAFIFDEVQIQRENLNIIKFPQNLSELKSDLNGISFKLNIDGENYNFSAPILGDFNYINISAGIYVARELGLSLSEIQKRVARLKPIEHRLAKMEVGGKIIIDDSFNGNLDGMLGAIAICKNHSGKKIIVTPGIVESSEEDNTTLAKAIDEVFDIVIITGSLNANILAKNIHNAKRILLPNKSALENTLKITTQSGDLILFANDAPSYI